MNIATAAELRFVERPAPARAAAGGPAAKEIVAGYGFWIFLLSDIVMFAALFAAYAVLVRATARGPAGSELFSQVTVAIETACLLASSYTCGLMSLAADARRHRAFWIGAVVTFALGAAFLALEVHEFADMVARGAAPQRSAFLSAFFALVGCHGLHVTVGLLWLAVMVAQVAVLDFRPSVMRRLQCFALFWHALDIVWVALFSVVYLMGVRP
jgi:cytochrome o ubiquinol oxidase subunit III